MNPTCVAEQTPDGQVWKMSAAPKKHSAGGCSFIRGFLRWERVTITQGRNDQCLWEAEMEASLDYTVRPGLKNKTKQEAGGRGVWRGRGEKEEQQG